jgi:enoyl-CoA hydratase/carnithine racemase
MMRLEVVDRVAYLTIDRPAKRNAMTREMWVALEGHVTAIEKAPDLAAVVLRGTGGSFSAGADLAERKASASSSDDSYGELAERTVAALTRLALPKIAQIDGPCFGAGCSLALACDVRISSPRSQFGIPALANGLVYAPALVQRLVQIVGSGSAGLLLFGGERWGAAEAAERGLVDRCAEDMPATVESILGTLRNAAASAIVSTAEAIRTAPLAR